MQQKMFQPKELEKIRSDLVECQSLAQDIEAAKKAGVAGIEIIDDRHKSCLEGLAKLFEQYGKK